MSERELITSATQFQAALRRGFAAIAEQGGREVWICDDDFNDWPLSDRDVLAQLTEWAKPHRRLTMIARQFDDVVRRHPRFVEWRRQWSHVMECRSPEPDVIETLPSIFLAPGVLLVRLSEPRVHRGVISTEPAEYIKSREHIDAISQRSVASFPAGVLGL